MEPDQHFTASVTLDGAELSYFGQEGMAEVVSGCVTFQFQCAVESTNGTGVQGGQIPELLFYGPTHVNGDNRDGSNTLTCFIAEFIKNHCSFYPLQPNITNLNIKFALLSRDCICHSKYPTKHPS